MLASKFSVMFVQVVELPDWHVTDATAIPPVRMDGDMKATAYALALEAALTRAEGRIEKREKPAQPKAPGVEGAEDGRAAEGAATR